MENYGLSGDTGICIFPGGGSTAFAFCVQYKEGLNWKQSH